MKIAFIGQKGIPATGGGVENYVDNIATRLARRGHAVLAYTREGYAPAGMYKRVEVIATGGIQSKSLDAISHTWTALWHAFSVPDLDVLHVNSVGPALLIPFAKCGFFIKRLFTGIRAPKIVFTFHSADWHHGKWGIVAKNVLRMGAYLGCLFADEVVTVSKSLRQVAKQEFGTEATYIPNGTDIHRITSDRQLKKFGIKKGEYIVFIARLVPHKNAHILMEAYQAMKKKFGKKLVIVGGSANTDDYVKSLQKMADYDPNIIMTGHQSGRTLKQLFANAACYVLPSSSEGLSISLLEAGSYGLPVVVSDIRENREIVQDLGYYARVNNVKSLTRALERVFTEYPNALEKAELLQEEVKYHYSWDNIVKAFEKVYERDSLELRGAPVRVNTAFMYK